MNHWDVCHDLFGHYHAFWRAPNRVNDVFVKSFVDYGLWYALLRSPDWLIFKDYKLVARSASYMGV